MPPTLCHETPAEGSPRLCVRRSLFHSASGESRKLHIRRLLLPFRFRPAMLGSESDGDSRPQNPSSLRAGIKHGVERAGKRYPTPGLYAPGGMVEPPSKAARRRQGRLARAGSDVGQRGRRRCEAVHCRGPGYRPLTKERRGPWKHWYKRHAAYAGKRSCGRSEKSTRIKAGAFTAVAPARRSRSIWSGAPEWLQ